MSGVIRRRQLATSVKAEPAIIFTPDNGGEPLVINKNKLKIPNVITSDDIPTSWNTVLGTLEICEGIIGIGNIYNSEALFKFGKCPYITEITYPSTIEYSVGLYSQVFISATKAYFSSMQSFHNALKRNNGTVFVSPFETANNSSGVTRHIFVEDAELTTLTIPNGIQTLSGSFTRISLTEVNCPNSVTTINAYFSYSPIQIITAENVTQIGSSAFNSCTSLITANFGAKNIYIGDSAFRNCNNLTTLTCNKLMSVGDSGFYHCGSLENNVLLEDNAYVGSVAFENCTTISNVQFLGRINCNSIAFKGCSSLNRVDITNIDYWYAQQSPLTLPSHFSLYENNVECTNITIPNSMTDIPQYLFHNCSSVVTVTLHNNVKSVAIYAFNECNNLTSINLPSSLQSINRYSFAKTKLTGQIVIPNSITTIPEYTFDGCSQITSFVIPDSVTTLKGFAFRNCTGLRGIYVDSIASWMHMVEFTTENQTPFITAAVKQLYVNGVAVVDIVIPDGETTIKYATFSNMTGVTRTITIPASVTTIRDYAFRNSNLLTSITCLAETPPTVASTKVFGLTGTSSFYVPDASVDAYKAASGWSYYASRIKPLSTKPS